jgi:hypothetical protein
MTSHAKTIAGDEEAKCATTLTAAVGSMPIMLHEVGGRWYQRWDCCRASDYGQRQFPSREKVIA